MSEPSTVRAASAADANALSILLAQLGYPAMPEEIPRRLAALEGHPGVRVFIAELTGRAVGVATVHVFPSIHSATPAAWLTTLVVAEGARGQGIGRQLVELAEQWAISQGATRISLTSGLHRNEAHSFYENLGYTQSGLRFTKLVTEG
jgi:GNAT superfamily N-acetyltransferase